MKKTEKVALVLSGGGAKGAYEAGVWQALTDLGINIDIVTGTSVGSINGAMVCQGDLELTIKMWRELETHMIFDVAEGSQPIDYAREIVINKGAGSTRLKKLLSEYVDEEKIRNSPVEFGLVTVERNTLKPVKLFKEDIKEGQIADFIVASASAYPAIHAHEIDGVEYIDGGYADVLPVDMAIEKGATSVIAVKLNAIGVLKHDSLKNAPNLTVIESKWPLGNTLIFDTDNARKIMRLGFLDAMKAFDVFEGTYYAFAKGSFNKTDTKMADLCAKLFDMDPTLVYTKDSFLKKLKEIIDNSTSELDEALENFKHLLTGVAAVPELIKDIKNLSGSHIFCLVIAQNIKEKGPDSIFQSRPVIKLLPEAVMAARFLVKFQLI